MRYLLDTDHISILQRRTGVAFAQLTSRIGQYEPESFVLSIISFHEQVLGAHSVIVRAKSSNDILRGYTLLKEIQQGFAIAPVLSFDATSNIIFEELRSQNIRVATMDLRIAAIALSHDLILLTRNVRDFGKIPGLVTEDWTV
ncbi:MAG: type II toxin-antitoxin system VapC family toxin [Symploca sp. SIO2E6]|nr:type II toxin-antitoxin system VapC family toxin [Symploca sp. SIO2E6]